MTKRTYSTPAIEEIRLDNEISLQLSSGDPTVNTEFELKATSPSGAPGMNAPESDPYQYENW